VIESSSSDGVIPIDIGEYCRAIEQHLTRVNAGHLVRIVGPGFELARTWALEGLPLSIVFYGIDRKAERHRSGRSTRPLRLEFCEADVRAAFDHWRRAIGLSTGAVASNGDADAAASDAGNITSDHTHPRKPSLTRHLDRAIERLTRVSARMDVPEPAREAFAALLMDVVALRDAARTTRGPGREPVVAALGPLDARVRDAAREALPPPELASLALEAERDLAAYRSRLTPEAWQTSVAMTLDRLTRDRLGLPFLDIMAT